MKTLPVACPIVGWINVIITLKVNLGADVGITLNSLCQVIESPCTNGKAVEMEPKTMMNSHHSYEPIDSIDYHSVERIPLKTSDNMRAMVNHDDTLEVLYRSVKNVKCYGYGC